MLAPRRLRVYPPPLLASIFPTAHSPLSPLSPLLTQKVPVTPLFPLHTQIVGGGGLKSQSSARTTSSITFTFHPFAEFRKMANHYRFSTLSNRCRRADILDSGNGLSIFQFPSACAAFALLKTDHCELTTIVGPPTFFLSYFFAGHWSLGTDVSRITRHESPITRIVGAPTFSIAGQKEHSKSPI